MRRPQPAFVVILAGVCAALHVGKLAPALPVLREALGLTLVQAGFLLSLVQLAGMAAGLAFGVVADRLGLRRSMLLGLFVLTAASAGGGIAVGVPALMLLRAVEGFGFLLVVLPAPGLVRQLVPAHRVSAMLGLWGAYMPLATALALLAGPLCIAAFGWRAWWWALAAATALMAWLLWRLVPAGAAPAQAAASAPARLRRTLAAPGPWLVALTFAAYSGQWLAVVGFLPVVYHQAGVSVAATGALTALVAAANIGGNVASGWLLQRGAAAPALLAAGFVTMALAAAIGFAVPALRTAALLLFSAVGGLIPATLFALALRLAPGEDTVSTTVGWVQQWSALGQFGGPPLVAWVAGRAGGWQWTGLATGALAVAGLVLTALLARQLGPRARAAARSRR
jgi:MFS transporter, CP family, cyanate transporter